MDFIAAALSNPFNRTILERLPKLALGETWLVAGCLFQSYWNILAGQPATDQINDYDIFYFDAQDLSYEAEDKIIKSSGTLFQDLPIKIEIRNQARVPLWFKEKFGTDFPTLQRARDSIDLFLIEGSCVGLSPQGNELVLYAPYGLDDIEAGLLRPNPHTPNPTRFAAKALSYQKRWPWLRIIS